MRVITVTVSFDRLVERAHEKIRQASRGMPAVMIRQLDGLAKVMAYTTSAEQRELVLEQAAMILRACEESVPEESDRADVRRRYDAVLGAVSSSTMAPWPTNGAPEARKGSWWRLRPSAGWDSPAAALGSDKTGLRTARRTWQH